MVSFIKVMASTTLLLSKSLPEVDVTLRVSLMQELFALPLVHMVLISVSVFFFNQSCIPLK